MIEKVFHQIWINTKRPELPDHLCRFRDTWLWHHPKWNYKLWNLDNLDFEPRCRSILAQCQHPAQMADLLRMEILTVHGGVYIDTDFECLKPIEALLDGVANFTCSEDGRYFQVAILGAERGSSLFRGVVDRFPKSLGTQPVNVETGPAFFTQAVLEQGFSNNLTVFPRHYFYPFNYHTVDRSTADLSESYGVHHYSDSWKPRASFRQKLVGKLRRFM